MMVKKVENLITKILLGLFFVAVALFILRIHGFNINKIHLYDISIISSVFSLLILVKCVFIIYYQLNMQFVKKNQMLQLEQIEDRIIFEKEGIYEVIVETESKNIISLKTQIKENETIIGFLQMLYRQSNYIVTNIVSIQKIADLSNIYLERKIK